MDARNSCCSTKYLYDPFALCPPQHFNTLLACRSSQATVLDPPENNLELYPQAVESPHVLPLGDPWSFFFFRLSCFTAESHDFALLACSCLLVLGDCLCYLCLGSMTDRGHLRLILSQQYEILNNNNNPKLLNCSISRAESWQRNVSTFRFHLKNLEPVCVMEQEVLIRLPLVDTLTGENQWWQGCRFFSFKHLVLIFREQS